MKFYLNNVIVSCFVVALFPSLLFAAYNDANLSADSSLITVGGITLTLSGAGGILESIEVGASSFTASLAAGSSLRVVSSDRYNMAFSASNGIEANLTCESSRSVLDVSLPSSHSGASLGVTVTPSTASCDTSSVASTGGGDGGGGGGGYVSPVKPTASSTAQITTATSSTRLVMAGSVLTSVSQFIAKKQGRLSDTEKQVVKQILVLLMQLIQSK